MKGSARTALGLDVGGTHIRAGVYDGEIVRPLEPRLTPQDYQGFLEQVRAIQLEAASLVGPPGRVGLGLPGVWLGDSIRWVPNIPCLEGRGLIPDLETMLGVEAVLANDAQMALLGEAWQGAARGLNSAVLVSLGTGIGGAIMVGGRVVRGARGSAGAFGWITLGPDEPGDPNHGPLERHASGKTLERLGQDLRPPRSSHEVIDGARRGEPACLDIVERLGARLGAALAGIASALDPEVLIVSGGLSEAFDVLESHLRSTLRRLASPNGREVPIQTAALRTHAGVYGSIYAALADEVFV